MVASSTVGDGLRPGEEIGNEDQIETPLPFGPMLAVASIQLCEAFNILMLFPFVYFMVVDFLPPESEQWAGLYAGIIGAMWPFGQFITSALWGDAADRFGRRPTLLLGTLGTSLVAPVFGFSGSILMAALTRLFGGALNGNVAVMKAVIGDITDDSNRARGYSICIVMYGLGSTFGPTLGGFLANSADREIFKNIPFVQSSVFKSYPYLLPCLAQCIVGLISFTIIAVALPETYSAENRSHSRLPSDDVDTGDEMHIELSGDQHHHVQDKRVMRAILVYSLTALAWVIYDETFPLLCASPPDVGGLGLNSSEIGCALAVSGIAAIVFQLVLFPMIEKRYEIPVLFRASGVTAACAFLFLPISGIWISVNAKLSWTLLLIAVCVQISAACACFACILMLVNNSANAQNRGAVNAKGQAMAAFARACGPFLSGMLWSFSVRNSNIPGHQWIPFSVAAAAILSAAVASSKFST
uniref:Major facilitator superfamily (MFS) profile domain-containing protein n=1 Tax=Timspurckia oligopyrenoides TaxID=708627 RepID=A0A6T6N9G4_9RHOD|mmetsp:Transcript_7109/g.12762  ORF Transcript_7109/g.12762 Transcript_7109/m.12762 type:complete len:470 (+) Transcript_7109:138-1547(+)|eukprot:CAMPEP_0182444136 /NCGR_PEP_ID=MMETSP1172-20130603/2683_1 /TAXON_ID=708627 /ORGANISM="Timspurckia oligopyrenoides, Strain CCMP3278" /LENGTH=469 /DNA_ID=CAMNT_0024639629 /DNA_START=130 /DNA_END=1539 /DNA_ORIENTATION=-